MDEAAPIRGRDRLRAVIDHDPPAPGLDAELLVPRLEIDPARRDHGGEQDLPGVQIEVPAVDVAVGGHGVGQLLEVDRQRPTDRVMPLNPGDELLAENDVALLGAPAEPVAQGRHDRGELAPHGPAPARAPGPVNPVPDLHEGLADLLKRVVGVDTGQRRDQRTGVVGGPSDPDRPQVEPLGLDLAEGHQEGIDLVLLGARLLRRQCRIVPGEILVIMADAPVLVGQRPPAPDRGGLLHDDADLLLGIPEPGHGAPAGPVVPEVEDVPEHLPDIDMILHSDVMAQHPVDERAAAESPEAELEIGGVVDDAGAIGEREVAKMPQIPAGQREVDRHAELLEGRRRRHDEVPTGRGREDLPAP